MKNRYLLFSALALLAACGEQFDSSDKSTQEQSLTAGSQVGGAARSTGDVIDRGDLDIIAQAAAARDIEALNQLLPALYVVRGPIQIAQQGPIENYAELTSNVYVRSQFSDALQLLTAEEKPVKVQLRDGDGRAHDIAFMQEEVEGGWWAITIEQSDLPSAGVLLVGPEDGDLGELDINTYALAVVDDVWECKGAEAQCADGDVSCMIEAHSPCIQGSLESRRSTLADAEPEVLIDEYLVRHGSFGEIEITTERDGSLTVHWTGTNQASSVNELAPTGDLTPLGFVEVDAQTISIPVPRDGFAEDTMILLEGQGDGISKYGAKKGTGIFAKSSHTWSMSGCLKFQDDGMNIGDPILPVRQADVRVSTSLGFGLFSGWGVVKTGSNGCFTAQRTFSGPFSKKKRKFRVKYRLHDGNFTVWNKFTWDGFIWGGFSELFTTGWLNQGAQSMGSQTFAPGQPAAYGQAFRRSQAVAFDALLKFDAKLGSENSWLKFPSELHFNYPMGSSWGVTPPNITFGTTHTTYLSDSGVRTIIHEATHAWHYKHKSGWIPNIIPGFLGPIDITTNGSPWPWNWTISFTDWGTHNCQEDDNLAFLEGFAEYVAREAICGSVFNSPECAVNPYYWGQPAELDDLSDSWACSNEGQPQLWNANRVVHNDDGVMHGLRLLTVDNHYRRDYVHAPSATTYAADVAFGSTLNKSCRWGNENFDVFDVMYAFRADPSKGYYSNFNIGAGNGLLPFYDRFADIYNTHVNFISERMPYIDPQTKLNPWEQCAKKCVAPAVMANGSLAPASLGPNQCDVVAVNPSIPVTTSGRKWYTNKKAYCPVGGYDGANCHVLTPAAGTTPFIWAGNLYTSALPGNICPAGWYDGANCFVAATPPGTTPFIWAGNLYTTAIYSCPMGVSVSSNTCLIGTTPSGTVANVEFGNVLGYLE